MPPARPALSAAAALTRLGPIALALAALVVLELSTGPAHPPVAEAAAPPAAHRLLLFWVDSLALEDMAQDSPHLPRLKARLDRALRGPVRQCADAVSVPCFTAAATGVDHFSLFSLVRNFGGVGRLPAGNLFEALQARGKRVGFIGDVMARKAVEGFDWVEIPPTLDDAYTIRRGLEAFEALALDVVVIHIRETDVTTHTHGPASKEYAAALEQADRLIDAAIASAPPDLHISVFGDHGHTEDGRHFAGLDVPTYAAFFGPTFSRPLERPMGITDYGALWGRVFGLRFADSEWISAYFSGAPLPPIEGLPDAPGGTRAPPIAALAGLALLILAVAGPWEWRAVGIARQPLLVAAGGLTLGMLALGLAWAQLRPLISYLPRFANVGLGLGLSLLGALALWRPWRAADPVERRGEASPLALLAAGAVLFSLPTVYKYGGAASGITALLVIFAAAAAFAIRSRRWAGALAALLGLAAAWPLWDPAVRNFKLRWFGVFTETLAPVIGPVALGLAAIALAAALRPGAGRPVAQASPVAFGLAAALGLGLALAVPHLPPLTWLAPCVITPLALALGWRRPWLTPVALACALPAFTYFFQADPQRLAPAAAAVALWPLWARARGPHASRLEAGATILLLITTAQWAQFGARISGIDFSYFFRWLPTGTLAFKETWAYNATLTGALYLSLPCLGLLLARRIAPATIDDALGLAWQLARGRLALCLVFIVGFSAAGGAGPFITSDVLQSAAVWSLTLLALLLAPGRAARARPPQEVTP